MTQYDSFLKHMSTAGQKHGFQDIMGSVWKVWRDGGTQKVQALLGYALDGSPMLSAFMKVAGTPSGPQREQFKFAKGMAVKITGGMGDGRQATMTPTAENDANPEPKYANDHHHTYQFASFHRRIGADSHEHFLVQDDSSGGSGGGTGGGTAMSARFGASGGLSGVTSGAGSGQQSDPYQNAIVVRRHGKKPQVQNVNGPWDGPTDQGNPIKQMFSWAGGAGIANQVDPGQKEQIFHGFGNRTSTTHEDGTITKAVGQMVKQIWSDLGSGGSEAGGGGGLGGLISKLVGQTRIDMNPSSILQKATGIQIGAGNNLDLKGAVASLVGSVTQIAGSPVKQQKTVMLGGLSLNLPSGLNSTSSMAANLDDALRIGDPSDDIYFTSSYSSATAPNDDDLGTPFPGMRWIDTTSGIEYSWNVVWSEGGGNVVFPATPNVGDTFNYGDRQWAWNGVGWASTLSSRATNLETSVGSLGGSSTSLTARVTTLESEVATLMTVIDGGTF